MAGDPGFRPVQNGFWYLSCAIEWNEAVLYRTDVMRALRRILDVQGRSVVCQWLCLAMARGSSVPGHEGVCPVSGIGSLYSPNESTLCQETMASGLLKASNREVQTVRASEGQCFVAALWFAIMHADLEGILHYEADHSRTSKQLRKYAT